VILYLFAGGCKCRLTTFPTRFAHDVSILCYCHCSALMLLFVLCHGQMNKYHIISKERLDRETFTCGECGFPAATSKVLLNHSASSRRRKLGLKFGLNSSNRLITRRASDQKFTPSLTARDAPDIRVRLDGYAEKKIGKRSHSNSVSRIC